MERLWGDNKSDVVYGTLTPDSSGAPALWNLPLCSQHCAGKQQADQDRDLCIAGALPGTIGGLKRVTFGGQRSGESVL